MESFRSKGDLLHGWGTLRGTGEAPCAVWLAIGGGRKIPVIIGKTIRSKAHRIDVDFVLYCTAKEAGSTADSLDLTLEWKDGGQCRLPLPPPRRAPPGHGVARLVGLPWKHYFSRGWRLARQGQSGLLLRKLAGMASAMLTSGWHPDRLLRWAASEGKPIALVIDHDLGGGANLYRRSLLDRLAAEGMMPLLLTAHHGILSYLLVARRGNRSRNAHLDDLPALFALLSQANIHRVVFNNILSFPEPLNLVNTLASWLQAQKTVQFLFLVHDYYSVCPIWLLLDHTGKYCGIPDATVCATCLHSSTAPFLEFAEGADIAGWRAAWHELLRLADEIRCFSNSSRTLLMRAHPQLDLARISVIPHRLDHMPSRIPMLQDNGQPVIGVIGHISHHKGAQVVRELARFIASSGSRARIVVIGTIELELPASTATVTGPYRSEELPALIERHGVNVGFFPSICPETFSYVAEEMMTMRLPVLAFDLGAPGERIAVYERGLVIPVDEPSRILAAIESLYRSHVVTQIRQAQTS